MVDHIPAHRYSNPGPFPPAHHHFQGYFNLISSEKHRTPSGTTGRNNTVKASENIYTNRCFAFHTLLFPPNAQKHSTDPSFTPPDLCSVRSPATATTVVALRRQAGDGTTPEPPSPHPRSAAAVSPGGRFRCSVSASNRQKLTGTNSRLLLIRARTMSLSSPQLRAVSRQRCRQDHRMPLTGDVANLQHQHHCTRRAIIIVLGVPHGPFCCQRTKGEGNCLMGGDAEERRHAGSARGRLDPGRSGGRLRALIGRKGCLTSPLPPMVSLGV